MAKLKITKLQYRRLPPSLTCRHAVFRALPTHLARPPDSPLPFSFLVTVRQASFWTVQTITMFPTASKLTVFGEATNDHEFHEEPNTFCFLSLFHPQGGT